MVLDIDCAPIAPRGAGSGKRAGADTPAFQWAAVFMGILYGVIAPGDHLMAGPAERTPSLLKVMSSGALPEDIARPLISISALISQRARRR